MNIAEEINSACVASLVDCTAWLLDEDEPNGVVVLRNREGYIVMAMPREDWEALRREAGATDGWRR